MAELSNMVQAARRAMVKVLQLTADDKVLVVQDPRCLKCAHAELGLGLNPKARLVGIMLEDEKALRTAHIAFGSNLGMPGGVNKSVTHIDYLVHRPTLVADGKTLIDDGEILV